jgi:lipoprotein-anchoring transpeptidase ErfK/SrfK
MRNIIIALLVGMVMVIGQVIGDAAIAGGKVFVFSLSAHRWYAYDNGSLVGSGRASGGRGYCPDIHRGCHTPMGTFHVLSKGPASCKSTIYPKPYGGAPMYYCMFFTRLYAIHGSNEVPQGFNASHGCIRVLPSAAAWLSARFMQIGTTVVVRP